MKFSVAQIGARMHYAVPKILNKINSLDHLYTDICAAKSLGQSLEKIPTCMRGAGLRKLLARLPSGLPDYLITEFKLFGLKYYLKRARARNRAESLAAHLWAGETFARLTSKMNFDNVDGIFTYNSAGLELLTLAKTQGLLAVMEQTIAPYKIEMGLLTLEMEKFPLWEGFQFSDPVHGQFAQREEEEWKTSDIILCGSEFVRQGIADSGGPSARCAVVPYGVNLSAFLTIEKQRHRGPLRVLTVGAVGLRKGSPYVIEAARQLKQSAVFRMVGAINAPTDVLKNLPSNLEMLGAVPRSEIKQHFEWADIFLLPSVCEGSATVTYEAFAAGLPVVCTPNTGSLVDDGEDGFLVPVGSQDMIVHAIEMLSDRERLIHFSINALNKAKLCSVEAYSNRLCLALGLE